MKKYSKIEILDTIYCMEVLIEQLEERGTSLYRLLWPICEKSYSVDLVACLWKELSGSVNWEAPTINQLKIMVQILKDKLNEIQ